MQWSPESRNGCELNLVMGLIHFLLPKCPGFILFWGDCFGGEHVPRSANQLRKLDFPL